MVSPQSSGPPHRSHSSGGFTLVEVALAIGIVAFAFVALLALLPAGNIAFRRSVDISVGTQIAQHVIDDAEQTDFNKLIDQTTNFKVTSSSPDAANFSFHGPTRIKTSAGEYRYFDDQGREVLPANANLSGTSQPLTAADLRRVIYVVNTRVIPFFTLPYDPSSPSTVTYPVGQQPLALVTVQVAHAPGGAVLPTMSTAPATSSDPTRNLWIPGSKPGIDIFTYSAQISHNTDSLQ